MRVVGHGALVVVLHDEALDHLFGDGFVLVVELADGLESELQVVSGLALSLNYGDELR